MQLFETERLFTRLLSHQDLPALAEILSDPEVMKYSVRGVCDKVATRKFIDWCLECYSSHGIGPWALVEKDSGDLVGVLGYAFGQKNFESVVVIIEPEHGASVRVSEKAGFRRYTKLEFHGRPVRLYRMTYQDWSILHNNCGQGTLLTSRC